MSLHEMFYPESVAVIGASPSMVLGRIPYYQILKLAGYKGRLYAVNPKHAEIDGEKAYPSIESLPEPVDLLIATVPARAALETVKEAAKKGVRFLHFFTSGFGESGNRALENEMLAARGETRILGPNCLGVHCTESRVTFEPFFTQEGRGSAAFIGQSGSVTTNFLWMGQSRKIPINKAVSIGNQMDVTVEELLEYLAGDDTVNLICGYIEDVRDGPGFVRVLKEATRKKPVVVLKGGRTESGAKTAASHTGAMAGSDEVWSAAMRQCGVIQVDTFEQMMDAVMLATSYNVPTGPRIGFLVAGGGTAVLFTDLAYGNGMEMPPLLKTTQERIFAETGIKSVNTFTSNPVDLGASGIDFKVMAKALSVMDDDPGIDILVPYFSIDFIDSFLSEQIECGPRLLVETAKTLKKPIIPILSKFTEDNLKKEDTRINIASVFREAGMPVFNNMQDYIHALRKVLGWSAKFTPRR